MNDELKKQMVALANELPVEAARQLEKILKDSFAGHGVPYGKEAIIACIAGLEITIPTIPMRYAQESQATLLLLYRLLDEAETGLVASPVKL